MKKKPSKALSTVDSEGHGKQCIGIDAEDHRERCMEMDKKKRVRALSFPKTCVAGDLWSDPR